MTDTPALEPAVGAPPELGLRATVLRGSAWTLVGFSLGQVLRLGTNLIMARLLFPEAFGLMSLVMVLLAGLELFSDLGIGQAVVQNPRGDQASFLGTAFTLQVARGIVLFALACLAAPLFGWVYGHAELLVLIPVTALGSLVSGLASLSLFSAQRRLALRTVTIVELACQTVAAGVMVGWCAFDRSVWALVAGGLANAACKTLLSHVAFPGPRARLAWSRDDAAAILHFGRWILVSTLLTFLATQADRLIFGRLLSLEMLGIYSIALLMASVPRDVLARLSFAIIFPLYSRVLREQRALRPVWAASRRWGLLGLGLALGGLFACGPALAELLYDDRYRPVGWMLRFLALGGWFVALEAMNGSALLAVGEARWVAAGNAAKLAALLVLVPLGFHAFGIGGAIAGFAASEIPRWGVSLFAIGRLELGDLVEDALATLLLGAATGAALACEVWLEGQGTGPFLRCAATGIVLALAWGPAWLALARARFRHIAV